MGFPRGADKQRPETRVRAKLDLLEEASDAWYLTMTRPDSLPAEREAALHGLLEAARDLARAKREAFGTVRRVR